MFTLLFCGLYIHLHLVLHLAVQEVSPSQHHDAFDTNIGDVREVNLRKLLCEVVKRFIGQRIRAIVFAGFLIKPENLMRHTTQQTNIS